MRPCAWPGEQVRDPARPPAAGLIPGDLGSPGDSRAEVPLPSGGVSAGTRLRSALWYVVHLLSGGLLAAVLFIGVPTGLVFIMQRFGSDGVLVGTSELGFLAGVDRWVLLVLGIALLAAIPYGIAAAGVALRRLAPPCSARRPRSGSQLSRRKRGP